MADERSPERLRRARVLIVDDQARARQSLKALLDTCPEIEAVYQAADGQEAVRLVGELRPEVVVMDVRMPGMDGIQATRLIKARWPQVRIVALSMYSEYAGQVLAAGADAFVSKADTPDKLLAALACTDL